MRVVVTGAAGFVGRHLCARLAASGHAVTGLARADGDLGDPALDWRGRLAGAAAVVHLAGLAHERAEAHERVGDYDAFRRVNAEATERLARQAAAAGVPHFVFASTIGVCGDETFGAPFTEASPPAPRTLYAKSKHEAEQRLAKVRAETALRVTVLRPTLVYGPGNAGNVLRLLRLVQRGWPLPFGAIRNRRNLTHVENLASAVGAVLGHAGAETLFIVSDAEALSTAELVAALAAGMGRKAMELPVPGALLRIAGGALGRGDMVRRLIGSLEADSALLRRATGWKQPVAALEGLRKTGEWFARADGE